MTRTTRSPGTTKLDDLRRLLLRTACRRDDESILPPPDSLGELGADLRKGIAVLLKRGFVSERDVDQTERSWREDGERLIGVFVTDAGRAEIEKADAAIPPAALAMEPHSAALTTAPASPTPRVGSKSEVVLTLLRREEGATLAEIIAATGWLPHTTRAALTGLRKKGHGIERDKRDNASCYILKAVA